MCSQINIKFILVNENVRAAVWGNKCEKFEERSSTELKWVFGIKKKYRE